MMVHRVVTALQYTATVITAQSVSPAKAGIKENPGFRVKPGMTNRMGLLLPCIVGLVLAASGCVTNTVYTGQLAGPAMAGEDEPPAILYWTKSDPVLGDPKAGPAVLHTACGRGVVFVERPEGIVFRGDPGKDLDARTGEPVTDGQICGRFVGHHTFVDLGEGDLQIAISCTARVSEFTAVPERARYLPPREDPYTFIVSGTESSSLFGEVPKVPEPPPCRTGP